MMFCSCNSMGLRMELHSSRKCTVPYSGALKRFRWSLIMDFHLTDEDTNGSFMMSGRQLSRPTPAINLFYYNFITCFVSFLRCSRCLIHPVVSVMFLTTKAQLSFRTWNRKMLTKCTHAAQFFFHSVTLEMVFLYTGRNGIHHYFSRSEKHSIHNAVLSAIEYIIKCIIMLSMLRNSFATNFYFFYFLERIEKRIRWRNILMFYFVSIFDLNRRNFLYGAWHSRVSFEIFLSSLFSPAHSADRIWGRGFVDTIAHFICNFLLFSFADISVAKNTSCRYSSYSKVETIKTKTLNKYTSKKWQIVMRIKNRPDRVASKHWSCMWAKIKLTLRYGLHVCSPFYLPSDMCCRFSGKLHLFLEHADSVFLGRLNWQIILCGLFWLLAMAQARRKLFEKTVGEDVQKTEYSSWNFGREYNSVSMLLHIVETPLLSDADGTFNTQSILRTVVRV